MSSKCEFIEKKYYQTFLSRFKYNLKHFLDKMIKKNEILGYFTC